MALYINTNHSAIGAQRNLTLAQSLWETSTQRLSSGFRINNAKDDAAGMAIGSRMSAQINGINTAIRNANDGISLLQTAEGAMGSITDSLQRMRELSVQASNASNNSADRQSLDYEFQQCLAQIQQIAQFTSFNGLKLLDGGFVAQSFMLGANPGDVLSIDSIASMQTSQLGSTGNSFQSTLTGSTIGTALTQGALTVNGVSVGASQAGTAPGQDATSATSTAVAINTVAADSQVRAVANPNVLTCVAASNFTDIGANTFSINGTGIGDVAAGGDAVGQAANLAAAIMAVSATTGVNASADSTSGVLTLTAADGRNIEIGFAGSGGPAANAAAAAANKAAFISQTGFAPTAVGEQAVSASAAQNTVQMTGALTLSDVGKSIVINGVNFTVADSSAPPAFSDPTHIILNIDITGGAGATAAADALGSAVALAQGQGLLGTVSLAYGGDTVRLTDVTPGLSTTAISTQLAKSVLARPVSGAAAVTSSTVTNRGSVSLSSSGENGISIGGSNPGGSGLESGRTAASIASTVIGISTLDLLTENHAQNAVASIDSALTAVDSSRALVGAYINRFSSTVSNLQVSSENLGVSRSRIVDADFAAETSQQIRSKIVQQAAIAMIAQANASQKMALGLLLAH